MKKEKRGGAREGAGRKKKEGELRLRNETFIFHLTKSEKEEVSEQFQRIEKKCEEKEQRKLFKYEVFKIILDYFEKNS